MRVDLSLTMELTQKLVMTPELRQAITVLQLSALELQQYLQQEILENPFLEIKEEPGEREEVAAAAEDNPRSDNERFDIDWQEYFADRSDLGYVNQPREVYPEHSYENFLTRGPSLQEHLQIQIDLAFPPGLEKHVGQYLVGCLDESGYLTVTLTEAAQKFGCSEDKVAQVLEVIQTFEPAGVGARDLKECLLIQLQQSGKLNNLTERAVRDYLEDIAQGRMARVASGLGVSLQKTQEIVDLLRSLNPKPGYQFAGSNEVQYVVPDVIVERINGEFVVLLNDSVVPRLGINSRYRSLLQDKEVNEPEAKKYLESRLNAASWLIRSLEQRRLTLYRVACCIVDIQKEFFRHGIKHLRPLNLKQVAEIVGVHESTVSRATAKKYMQTPQGVFEFKFFFSSGISSSEGNSYSSQSIKKLIREIIEAEDPHLPWSDQKITKQLNQQGVPVSRRTIAKYRTEMGIPSATLRKRY
ncbi:MAG: RNA polymerase factor sigma-54 [Syntrophomonadaceae bacterium]|nr:RNA polymerase factor sigma-54 [Syntrophomonadaceae bacterium]